MDGVKGYFKQTEGRKSDRNQTAGSPLLQCGTDTGRVSGVAEVSVSFVDNEQIRELNHEFS